MRYNPKKNIGMNKESELLIKAPTCNDPKDQLFIFSESSSSSDSEDEPMMLRKCRTVSL